MRSSRDRWHAHPSKKVALQAVAFSAMDGSGWHQTAQVGSPGSPDTRTCTERRSERAWEIFSGSPATGGEHLSVYGIDMARGAG